MLFKILTTLLLACSSALLVPQDADGEAAAEAPRAGDYFVDSGHSCAIFRVTHMGVSAFWGRFNTIEGSVHLDPDDASKSSVSITILASSIDSNSDQRDEHLKSPDFFNTKEFSELSFRSSEVAAGADGALALTGEFTMLGETRSISFVAEPVGFGELGRMGYRAGWEAEFSIKRSDYGMGYLAGALGDEVRIIIALEAVLQ